MNIVFASHSPPDKFLVVGSHHLATEMALAGHTVWHLGPPITPVHFLFAHNRVYRQRVRRFLHPELTVAQRLTYLAPISAMPWQVARHFLKNGNAFVHLSNIAFLSRRLTASGPVDLLLVDDPRFMGLDKILKPKSVFYRPTDLYSEMKNDSRLIEAERGVLARSGGVIATSYPVLLHAQTLKPGLPSLLLENGVDHLHFSQSMPEPEELRDIPSPRVIYVGAVDFRFDCALTAFLAERFPAVHFVIVGPGDRLDLLRSYQRPNIHILGPKPYQVIPGYMQHCDVGMLPLADSVTNSGRSPMKLYEYGSAGLPVIARFTEELDRRKETFIHLFKSADEAVVTLQRLLDQPGNGRAISESCRSHSWATKASTILDFVVSATKPPQGVKPAPKSHRPEAAVIAFNGRFLNQEMTGVQRYGHGLLGSLGSRLRVIRPPSALSPTRGHLWEQTTLPRLCRGSLLWSPGNTGPLATARQVVTIHDASTLDHPEWFSGKFAHWYRFLLPRLTRRVRRIITVSNFSKERLIATCSIPPDRVAVVYNAIDLQFRPAPPAAVAAFRQKHQLERPFFLYMGSLEPRKNLPVLLKAWTALSAPDCDLAIAGASGHVFREKGPGDLPPGVRLLGRVPDDDLSTLLTAARCFVFPSLYEGFGYPPLEAMACGCPVICSDTTSLPEVCGPEFDLSDPASTGAALYFNPTDPGQLASQMKIMLAMSPAATQRLVNNGIARAAGFSWDLCAAKTWAVLEEALS